MRTSDMTSARIQNVLFVALASIGLLVLTPKLGQAQIAIGTSNLNGTVTDTSGAVVPNAKVTISSPTTGFSRSVVTNSSGRYYISQLTPGVYSVSVEAQGFKKEVLPGITLYVGQTPTEDFRLQLGTVHQQVSVTGQAPLLNTTNGQLGTIVTGTLMTQLPLNGRNFMQLNLLSPGAIEDKTGDTSNAVNINPEDITFSVNGMMSDYNVYLLDGLETKDWQHGTQVFSPSVDGVQEFQTTSADYSAALGSMGGAQVNLVIKSGTNQLHGTAWEYLRNNALDARDFFQPGSTPPFRRNQFGANLGGPVYFPHIYHGQNKTFFFFNYEGYRQTLKVPETRLYPTPTQLAGDESSLVTAGEPIINPFTGQPFPGNTIPASDIRPSTLESFLQNGIGKGLWIPHPNVSLPGINYIFDSSNNYSANQEMARIDQTLSNKSSIYGHFTYDRELVQYPSATVPSWYETDPVNDYTIAGHYTHIFSPTFLFDVGGGYVHFIQEEVTSTEYKYNITGQILGITGNATDPGSYGPPNWSVEGYSALGAGAGQSPREWWVNTGNFRPTFTLTRGPQTLQWGLDFDRINENFPEVFIANGIYDFTGEFTNYPLGDFLLDLPNTLRSSPDPFSPDTYNSLLGPYFEDDWKVTRNLTLNLGLRYEWAGIPLSSNHRSISNIYLPPNNGVPELFVADDAAPPVFGGVQQKLTTEVPFVRASSIGMPEQLAFNDNTAFAPRFGFAYKLPRVSNTVLRGGYGIYYDKDIQDRFVEASVDPPFVASNELTLGSTNFQTFDPVNPYVNETASAAQIFGNDIHNKLGMTQAYNLTLERSMWNTLFSVGYVGDWSTHLPVLADPNQAAPGPGNEADNRRWPSVGVFDLALDNGNANYNSLQVKVQHNFFHGLDLLASYTWARALSTSDGTYVGEGGRGGDTQDLLNPGVDYGLAAQDVGQDFVISYVYQLPVGNGKRFLNRKGAANLILGGWSINGVTTAATGSPFTINQTFNGANTDTGNFSPNTVAGCNPALSYSRSTGQQVAEFFNTACFSENVPVDGVYKFGNTGRNTVIGPGTYDWDFALYKDFSLSERLKLQFRTEVFNIFNNPIFAQPNGTLGSPGFGALTSTYIDPREIQFALRFSF